MKAGLTYFALAFALGLLLGVVRTLFVADLPGAGRLIGVLIEIPIMLGASWIFSGFVIRRFAVAPTVHARLLMGAVAFVLLILAEMAVGVFLFGRSPSAHIALYREASYAIGLAAQVVFALMPLLRLGLEPTPPEPQ